MRAHTSLDQVCLGHESQDALEYAGQKKEVLSKVGTVSVMSEAWIPVCMRRFCTSQVDRIMAKWPSVRRRHKEGWRDIGMNNEGQVPVERLKYFECFVKSRSWNLFILSFLASFNFGCYVTSFVTLLCMFFLIVFVLICFCFFLFSFVLAYQNLNPCLIFSSFEISFGVLPATLFGVVCLILLRFCWVTRSWCLCFRGVIRVTWLLHFFVLHYGNTVYDGCGVMMMLWCS